MLPLRLSRVRFVHQVLIGGSEFSNFQETDDWYLDQQPPPVSKCAYVIELKTDQQIVVITNRNGQSCFSPITNLVSGNYYPFTQEEPKLGPVSNGRVIIKSDANLDKQIALDLVNIPAGVSLNAPSLRGATGPQVGPTPVLGTTPGKYSKKSPVKIK
jgi:hypothetical protein